MGVLGSILLKPDVCDDIALALRKEDFHDESHSLLFEHMLDMHTSGKRIDVTLLVDRLKKAGDFEAIGGAPGRRFFLTSHGLRRHPQRTSSRFLPSIRADAARRSRAG